MQKTNEHKPVENRLWEKTPIRTIVGSVCLALAVLIAIYFGTANALSIVFSLLCLISSIGFFTAEIMNRARYEREGQLTVNEADKGYFDDAEVIPVLSTKRMFRSADEIGESDLAASNNGALDAFDALENTASAFLNLTNDFVKFAEENGCKIDASNAKSIFASIASSRILVVREMTKADFELLVRVIAAFFGTDAYIDRVGEDYHSEGNLLFDVDDKNQKKAFMLAIEAARANQQSLHFVALTDVSAANVKNYIKPIISYAKAPQATHAISMVEDGVVDRYYLPENLWCILHLAEGESTVSLPEPLLAVCSTKELFVSVCEKAEFFTQVQTVTYPQMELMIDKLKCNIPEGEWKKLDAFIDFLNQSLPLSISNKQWIGMEKYIAVLMECEESAVLALDEGIATRVIPAILAKATKAKKKADIIAGLNAAFESGEILASRKAAKSLTTADFVG